MPGESGFVPGEQVPRLAAAHGLRVPWAPPGTP
jgi:hypothetical protein